MKRKVILYTAVSLDGYIADKNGKTGWIGGEYGSYQGDYGLSGFMSIVDTVIMGMETYKQITGELSPGAWPYAGKTTYVLSHRPAEDTEEIKFIDSKISTLIQNLQQEEGSNIWICGGADVANQAVAENLIDEYHLTVMPIILGSGIRLFKDNNKEIKLHLVKNINKNGVIDCLYEKR